MTEMKKIALLATVACIASAGCATTTIRDLPTPEAHRLAADRHAGLAGLYAGRYDPSATVESANVGQPYAGRDSPATNPTAHWLKRAQTERERVELHEAAARRKSPAATNADDACTALGHAPPAEDSPETEP